MSKNRLSAEDVKAGVSPLAFYQHEISSMPTPRRDRGWVDGGLCPFHKDRHRGNFRVNLDSGAFTCFTCGAKGQDVIAFLQLRYGTSFGGALSALARDWGVRA